jgi:hypothetical protein
LELTPSPKEEEKEKKKPKVTDTLPYFLICSIALSPRDYNFVDIVYGFLWFFYFLIPSPIFG